MLTKEKIKKLKPGDELIHKVYFKSVDDDGYIRCDFSPRHSHFVNTFAVDPGVLTLPEEYTILYFPESLFKNITPNEKQQLTSFFHSYYIDKRKKNEMRVLLKKTGIGLIDTPSSPTRLFKNGDIVRYVERDGRSYVDAPPVGAICHVIVGEDSVGMVSVEFKFSENEEPAVHDVPFYHLELITPVEELEPYLMLLNVPSNSIEVRDKRTNKVEATFYFGKDHAYTFEQADTRAEAERDRLNAEWRKNQNND